MDNARAIELLKIERECIVRNITDQCNRECEKCNLVQNSEELICLYDYVIENFGETKTKTNITNNGTMTLNF